MSGETIGLLLAINSGILSVVGLITIFISMNSQHSVQRSREILWDIFTLPYKKNLLLEKGAIGQEVFRKLILYEQIIKERNSFLFKIITFSQMVLTFSGIIWTTIVLTLVSRNPSQTNKIILFAGLSLTLCFFLYFIIKILGDLKNVSKVGQLPTVEELLDANDLASNLNVVTLAAVSSRLKILDTNLYLGFPIPFKNLRMKATVQNSREKEENSQDLRNTLSRAAQVNNYRKLDPEEFILLDDDYCYYLISNLQPSGSKHSFFASIDLLSKQGLVTAEFYCEGLTSSNHKITTFPYSFAERFINRRSDLDPFSRYQKRQGKDDRSDDATAQINIGQNFMDLIDQD
ncbi:hypothetical protein Desaci_4161 [Desulfosporosinus acidiphilus SJ4]|uniref:Uncharacterized protein n=2 Tax=Desulfosporosinus TaxID=79206 RepID=I4DB49_DESAJ|nr:hypothetical protein Desaci_4161 [Desulfosporosinus acidiphilus SJ4]